MSKTKRSEHKERREWEDLQNEKKAFLKRVEAEEQDELYLRNLKAWELLPDDDPPI